MEKQSFLTRAKAVWLCVIAALLVGCGFMVPPANADEAGTGSITVTSKAKLPDVDEYGNVIKDKDGNAVYVDNEMYEGAEFDLYKIADVDVDKMAAGEDGWVKATPKFDDGAFKSIGITEKLVDGSDETMRDLATTLRNVIKANGYKPEADAVQKTDKEGNAVFSDLGAGVYFILSPLASAPEFYYSAQIVSLPVSTAQSDRENMNVSATAKYVYVKEGKDPIHVKKVWEDGNSADRPKSIKVNLFLNIKKQKDKDLELIDTVELNAGNNWSYEWADLPEFQDYAVTEAEVPEGYKMTIVEDQVSKLTSFFTITNTKPTTPDTPKPVTPTTPTPSKPDTPAQTGANVTTVAMISVAALGLAILLFVEVMRSRKRDQE